ncbi:hypothetical protein [Deinococcus aluminii]|uniref:Type IV secretion system protein n=1 Tax=Deinococcus aluminii TaxID=1656885 RepID=A0ABP9XEV0_9DEIO
MIRRLLTVLALLLTLAAPALAAQTQQPNDGGVVCQTLADRSGPADGGNRVNLETFVPDPGCWLQESAKEIYNRNLYGVTAKIGMFIVVASILIAALKSIPAASPTTFMKALALGAIIFSALLTYDRKMGGGWFVAETAMSAWTMTYTASSRVGQAILDQTVLQKTADLTLAFGRYVQSTAVIQSVATYNSVAGDETDPATLENAWRNLQGKMDARSSPFQVKGLGAITYFLMLGIFSVFAALVYSSGMLVLLAVLAFPIVLALSTLGSLQLLKTTGVIWLSNVVIILVLPIFMAILLSTTLSSPINTLQDNVTYNAQLASEAAAQVKAKIDACPRVFTVVCRLDTGLKSMVATVQDTLETAFMGVLVGGFAVVVAFTIAMTQLRRIPAAIERIFGGMGGGESSGAHTDFFIGRKQVQRVTNTQNNQQGGQARPGGGGPRMGGAGGGGAPVAGGAVSPNPSVTAAMIITSTTVQSGQRVAAQGGNSANRSTP